MKQILLSLLRLSITLLIVALAAIVGWRLYVAYALAPTTRDGRVRVDSVQIAPDVSGLIDQVAVFDNQNVRAGQILFRIDAARFDLAVRQAQDAVQAAQVALDQAAREERRDRRLGSLVPAEQAEQAAAKQAGLKSGVTAAQDALAVAQLNLDRATVRAPIDGTIVGLNLLPGAYAVAGKPVLVEVATRGIYVEGYFEETKLPRVALGDKAEIRLMGETELLYGHVVSIAPAIADRERAANASLLPDINPTFSWVRLAQRIPVRILIDRVPPDVRLIAGRTATVTITTPHKMPKPREFWGNLWGTLP
jgi:multidrug resistance efflux pump